MEKLAEKCCKECLQAVNRQRFMSSGRLTTSIRRHGCLATAS